MSSPITPEQARKLHDQIRPHLLYLHQLCDRMRIVGFRGDDPLYRSAMRAKDALQELLSFAHYASIAHGVGQRDTKARGTWE